MSFPPTRDGMGCERRGALEGLGGCGSRGEEAVGGGSAQEDDGGELRVQGRRKRRRWDGRNSPVRESADLPAPFTLELHSECPSLQPFGNETNNLSYLSPDEWQDETIAFKVTVFVPPQVHTRRLEVFSTSEGSLSFQ